jgi:hypothetical protein
VKTVNIQAEDSKVPLGQDRRLLSGVTLKSDRYRLGHLSVDLENIQGWLNVQSGQHKPLKSRASVAHVIE